MRHEKKAFWQFFSIYFGSVAFLILAAGFFYFGEQRKVLTEKEHFSMIEHIRKLKMSQHESHKKGITHIITHKKIDNFNINNFRITPDYFEAYMPYRWNGGYYRVRKDKSAFYKTLLEIKYNIIIVQIVLLILFALISYLLAMRALRPMQRAIMKLDNFSKDLIHDLNTPITSMLLNMKLLASKEECQENKALLRIKQSLLDIGELHTNLMTLLEEESMVMQDENIFEIIQEVVATHRKIYPNLQFIVKEKELYKKINKNAFKQVMQNIISNACKYNKEDGYLKIYMQEDTLCVEDGGVGIKESEKVFERDYTEHSSGHGIGLDIVQRLCDVMEIKISIHSEYGVGTTICLDFL